MRTLIQTLNDKQQILVGGHRGQKCSIRENTIDNFNALDMVGISHLEVDIQLSKDKVALVYHDMELRDQTQLKGMIRDYTYSELKNSFEIQTLDEVVKYAKQKEILLALEIKTNHLIMQDDVLYLMDEIQKILEKYEFFEYSFVFSVDYRALDYLKRTDARVNIGLIVPHIPVSPAKLLIDHQAIIYLTYLSNLSQDIIDEVHNAGFFIDASVVNDEKTLLNAVKMKADLLESDYPRKIVEWLGKL